MQRKWMILAGTMVTVAALATGLALAADDDSPIHKVMEEINAKNLAITKAVRTELAYKKASKSVAASAQSLLDLSKKARGMKEGYAKAKDVKDPEKKWKDQWDHFDMQTANLLKVASGDNAKQTEVKSAHGLVKQSCTDCHNVFRVEEDSF